MKDLIQELAEDKVEIAVKIPRVIVEALESMDLPPDLFIENVVAKYGTTFLEFLEDEARKLIAVGITIH